MKHLPITVLITVLISVLAVPAHAMTFWNGGVMMGTVCRNGYYFTNYPMHMAQPVGSSCPIRDAYGYVLGYGVVTTE